MEIKKTYNPLTLSHDYRTFENEGLTPNQFLRRENIVFTRPAILLVNGIPVLRKNWGIELQKTDVCHFVELPRGDGQGGSNPLQFVAMIALVAVAAYTGGFIASPILSAMAQGAIMIGGSMIINSFFAENLMPAEGMVDPKRPIDVYNLNSVRNTLQIGQPFAEHFGRFRCHPVLAMAPYTEYIGNDQYLYFLGIIGVGEYDIENVYIGDMLANSFAEIDYNIIAPSGTPTICPKIVYTEVIGLEISESWLAVIATPPIIQAYKFEFDIVCPSGLHEVNATTGDISTIEVTLELESRTVDDSGTGTSAWVAFFTKSYSAATRDPIRHTISKIILTGNDRYEFRMKRTTAKSTDPLITDTIFFENLRAFGPDHPDYGDVTLIEMSVLATEQINNSTANNISIIATRKLYPVTDTGFGATKAVTRSIIDACAYIVTADNGGKQPDSILEFESLADLRADLATRENWFDHRFTAQTTVMNACGAIARCGRSVPYTPGGLFSLVRDKLQTVSTQLYTDDDYTENSLTLDHIIRTDDDATCVEIEYVDPDTWQKEKISYYEAGGSLDNPSRLTLVGCTSRQHAYEEAAYLYKSDECVRTNISFMTGLKGHVPKLGDMIYVASRHINWGQTGQLAHISATVATLSEPVDFGETAVEGKLLLTSKTGGLLGEYTVTPGTTAHTVNVALTDTVVNTIHAQGEKATKFVFGETVEELLRVRILKILPSSVNEIKILGSIIDDDIHDDPGTVPALVIIQPDDSDITIDPDPDPTDGSGYIYGGYLSGTRFQDCDEYTPDTWTSKTDMPLPVRSNLSASTINDKGYVYSGQQTSLLELQDCDEYSPDTWASKTNMPAPERAYTVGNTLGSSGYVYSGEALTTALQDNDQYTPDTWVSKANIFIPARSFASGCTINTNIYIFSGYTDTYLDNCEAYAPDTWVSKTDVPLPLRDLMASSAIGSSGFVFGGRNNSGDSIKDCDQYTPDTWTSKADLITVGRYLHAASTIGDSGYIYGGKDSGTTLNYCDQYILNTWISKSNLPTPNRHSLAASTII